MKRECDSFLYGETRSEINTKKEKLFQLKENVGKKQKDNMETISSVRDFVEGYKLPLE